MVVAVSAPRGLVWADRQTRQEIVSRILDSMPQHVLIQFYCDVRHQLDLARMRRWIKS